MMNIEQFGEQLRALRKQTGLSQTQLANRLEQLAQSATSDTYRAVDASLISKWERARQRNKHPWKPTYHYVIYLIELFADQLTWSTASTWANQAGYQIPDMVLQKIFTPAPDPLNITTITRPMQHPPLPDSYIQRETLETTIQTQLQHQQTVVLVGLGGSGKSILAASIAEQVADQFMDGVIWVDDCQDGAGGYRVTTAQDRIAHSFQVELQGQNSSERAAQLRSLLRGKQCLLVLDDVWDTPDLRHLRVHRDPSRMLITTRNNVIPHIFGAITPVKIGGLTASEGYHLLQKSLGGANLTQTWQKLLEKVEFLPLGVSLISALLQSGYTTTSLLHHFDDTPNHRAMLDVGLPHTRLDSLNTCFDLNYDTLPSDVMRRYFAQLSCFNSLIIPEVLPIIWGVDKPQVGAILHQLIEHALVSREANRYRLHPLVRYYAYQKFTETWAESVPETYRRYASFLIHQILYHPQLLPNSNEPVPTIDPY